MVMLSPSAVPAPTSVGSIRIQGGSWDHASFARAHGARAKGRFSVGVPCRPGCVCVHYRVTTTMEGRLVGEHVVHANILARSGRRNLGKRFAYETPTR